MPRFVVLTHDWPAPHWDFMLEEGAALRTFRLEQPPDAAGAGPATALPPHRLAYLEYEGPVSGGRGSVTRWDCGEYEVLSSHATQLALRLHGMRLTGRVLLVQADSGRWTYQYAVELPA